MASDVIISIRSAIATIVILGMLGVYSVYDVVDGPGSARQESVARTPNFPQTFGALPRFISDARFHIKNRYALKDTFVRANGAVKGSIFEHSAAADVIFGEDDYLFLASHETIGMVQGLDRLNATESAEWAAHFDRVSQAFQNMSIPFAFILAPNKHSLYDDALPDWVKISHDNKTRSDDILEIAQRGLRPPPVSVKQFLKSRRNAYPNISFYHKTDTHWNEFGAALAMRAVFKTLGTTLGPVSINLQTMPRSGDMARMLGQQEVFKEVAPVLVPAVPWRCFKPDGTSLIVETIDPLMPRRFSCSSDAVDGRTIVVFTDSFGIPAIPYLASSFQNVEFIWADTVDLELAMKLEGDVVIQIIVERKFMTITPRELMAGNDAQ